MIRGSKEADKLAEERDKTVFLGTLLMKEGVL